MWVPEPHSVVFEDCVDAESRGHTWARNDDGYLKCRLKTSCHAVVHIGGELVVRSLWEDELPRYIELVTEGVDSADEEGSDGKFAHNEVLSYGHGEQLIGSEHPLGNDNACLNCAVRLRPKPVEPPAEEGVQRKLSLHLANVSFGLGSDDTETVFDKLTMQKLLHAAVLQDTVQNEGGDLPPKALFLQLVSRWAQ